MKLLIAFFLVFVMMPLCAMWKGYVASVLWRWFVMPLGAPALGVAHAIGLGCVIMMFTHQYNANDEGEDSTGTKIAKAISVSFFLPLMMLAVGAIAKHFMP